WNEAFVAALNEQLQAAAAAAAAAGTPPPTIIFGRAHLFSQQRNKQQLVHWGGAIDPGAELEVRGMSDAQRDAPNPHSVGGVAAGGPNVRLRVQPPASSPGNPAVQRQIAAALRSRAGVTDVSPIAGLVAQYAVQEQEPEAVYMNCTSAVRAARAAID